MKRYRIELFAIGVHNPVEIVEAHDMDAAINKAKARHPEIKTYGSKCQMVGDVMEERFNSVAAQLQIPVRLLKGKPRVPECPMCEAGIPLRKGNPK